MPRSIINMSRIISDKGEKKKETKEIEEGKDVPL
jgi:hypothetical protein